MMDVQRGEFRAMIESLGILSMRGGAICEDFSGFQRVILNSNEYLDCIDKVFIELLRKPI
jgi:hypothetical protein